MDYDSLLVSDDSEVEIEFEETLVLDSNSMIVKWGY